MIVSSMVVQPMNDSSRNQRKVENFFPRSPASVSSHNCNLVNKHHKSSKQLPYSPQPSQDLTSVSSQDNESTGVNLIVLSFASFVVQLARKADVPTKFKMLQMIA